MSRSYAQAKAELDGVEQSILDKSRRLLDLEALGGAKSSADQREIDSIAAELTSLRGRRSALVDECRRLA
jgi:hypothetical protein